MGVGMRACETRRGAAAAERLPCGRAGVGGVQRGRVPAIRTVHCVEPLSTLQMSEALLASAAAATDESTGELFYFFDFDRTRPTRLAVFFLDLCWCFLILLSSSLHFIPNH